MGSERKMVVWELRGKGPNREVDSFLVVGE